MGAARFLARRPASPTALTRPVVLSGGGWHRLLHVELHIHPLQVPVAIKSPMVTPGSSVRQGVMFGKDEVRRTGLGSGGRGEPQRVMSLRWGKDKEKARR